MDIHSRVQISRRIESIIADRMSEAPVVLLEGPRSVGKSRLLHRIAASAGTEVIDLDEPETVDAVIASPGFFVDGASPVCIDEYQKAPIVLDAMKSRLNRDATPGRYLLAGSTRFESLPIAAQSLTGRLQRVQLAPFTQTEIDGTANGFVRAVLSGTPVVEGDRSTTTREEYIQRVVRGGFPLALAARSDAARARWFVDYLRLALERDARELTRLRQSAALPGLLGRLMAQLGQVLNIRAAGEDLRISYETTTSYTRLLEALFLIQQLPAWGTTLGSRVTSSPKLHAVDSGIAAHLLRLGPAKLARRDPAALTEFGHLFETFAVGEILRQASWEDAPVTSGHWRTVDGDEVDLILERADGGVVAFEIKAGTRVPGEQLAPMRRLRDRLGEAFLGGYALSLGERGYTFEDRIHVVPADRLWV